LAHTFIYFYRILIFFDSARSASISQKLLGFVYVIAPRVGVGGMYPSEHFSIVFGSPAKPAVSIYISMR
jgi:hypothetical protein